MYCVHSHLSRVDSSTKHQDVIDATHVVHTTLHRRAAYSVLNSQLQCCIPYKVQLFLVLRNIQPPTVPGQLLSDSNVQARAVTHLALSTRACQAVRQLTIDKGESSKPVLPARLQLLTWRCVWYMAISRGDVTHLVQRETSIFRIRQLSIT